MVAAVLCQHSSDFALTALTQHALGWFAARRGSFEGFGVSSCRSSGRNWYCYFATVPMQVLAASLKHSRLGWVQAAVPGSV